MTASPAPKAYSYLRFSTPEQMKGDSFRRQSQLAEAYAQEHGLDLDRGLTFHDLGVSAFRGKNAETGALRAFLRGAEDGVIEDGSHLLVESLDRISRSAVTDAQGLFLSIIGQGITIVTLADRKVYSKALIDKNPMDLILSLLTMIRANEESLTKSRRLKAAWEAKRSNAETKPLTKLVPAWLTVTPEGKIVEIPDRASLVRRVFDMYLSGCGRRMIAQTFNREAIPVFGRGTQWHDSYVAKILDNPAVVGRLIPHTVETVAGKAVRKPGTPVEGYYPAVVDPQSFARVQGMRDTPSSPKISPTAPVRNMLAGLARCPKCGGSMLRVAKGRTTKAGPPYLVCSKAKGGAGCVYRAVRMSEVENGMRTQGGRIEDALLRGSNVELDDRIEELQDHLWVLQNEEEEILKAIAKGGHSIPLSRKLREIQNEWEKLSKEHGQLLDQQRAGAHAFLLAQAHAVTEALAGDDLGKVNRVLREVLSSVTIDYDSGNLVFTTKAGITGYTMYRWPDEAFLEAQEKARKAAKG